MPNNQDSRAIAQGILNIPKIKLASLFLGQPIPTLEELIIKIDKAKIK